MNVVNALHKMAIGSATWKDLVERRWLKLLDRLHLLSHEACLQETAAFLGISIEEAVARSKEARSRHKLAWHRKGRLSEADILSFYGEDNNYLFSLPWRYRLHTWHFVPRLSPGPRILEYGCGTAEMTKWLLRRYPEYHYSVADLAVASTLPFVRFRFRDLPVEILEIGLGKEGLPLQDEYDFIVCVEVLEHCLDPLMVVEHLHEHLASQGVLYTNFLVQRATLESDHNSENLRSAALKHDAVIQYLEQNLLPIKSIRRLEPEQDLVAGWDCFGIYRNG